MSSGGKRAAVGTTSSASIPSGSKKMVQSMKEIVNCSEMEIYSMLKECNMDPSEAVHRLLTQDTFHEVKSKREKKKEPKDIPESRSRAPNNNSNRGPRGGADRGVRVNSTQIGLNDYGVAHGKLVHKKENGAHSVPPSSVVVSNAAGSNLNRKSPKLCEVMSVENTTEAIGTTGGLLPSQPSPGFQHNWSRAPGQLSMADIVKMGKPQGKTSNTPTVASDFFHPSRPILTNTLQHNTNWPSTMIPPSEPDPDFHTSQGPVPEDEEISHELGTGQHSSDDGWSLDGKMPTESGTDYPQTSRASSIYADPSTSSTLLVDEVNSHLGSHSAENQAIEEHVNGDSLLTESIGATPLSDRVLEVDKFGHSSHVDDGTLSGIDSYHTFEHHEVVDTDEEISSAAQNLQQLNLHKGELGVASAEDNPAVIIPSHLQVTNADCSHLSFGSFGSGIGSTFCGLPSQSLTSNLEAAQVAEDAPSLDQSHSRTTEYYDNDQLESSLNENLGSRSSPGTGSYDVPPATQPDTVREESLDAAHRIEGNFPSVSSYGYSATTQQTAAAYAYPESSAEMQNLSPFSSLMQPYTNSLPSSLLAQTAQQQPHREVDHPFSALLPTQSMPLKYSTTTSSISGPTISIPEGQSEVYSTPQSTLQALPNTNIPGGGGPALPQHLPLHPYSQPTLPLGHFANMISYPFLPQSYTFLPSAAYQQAYAGNSPFHQSPAAGMKYTLPQYKSSVPGGTSLPQSSALPPGYGGLSNSTNSIPGSFSLNPSTPASATPSVDEVMSSLYKEGSHYLPLQQNENSAMWLHGGAGSRAMSALPSSTFYGFQGQQNQHNGGYRQVQQQASPYGPMGYMNFYQSQGGPTQEQHQQTPSEGNLSGSQGPTSQQLWQHGY